jgi:hypothetical protein
VCVTWWLAVQNGNGRAGKKVVRPKLTGLRGVAIRSCVVALKLLSRSN